MRVCHQVARAYRRIGTGGAMVHHPLYRVFADILMIKQSGQIDAKLCRHLFHKAKVARRSMDAGS